MNNLPPVVTSGQIALIVVLTVVAAALAVFVALLFVGLVRKRRFAEASEIEYLTMSSDRKFLYRLKRGLYRLPDATFALFSVHIPNLAKKFRKAVCGIARTIKDAAVHGDWKTRCSFAIMGFSYLARKRIARGLLFLALEVFYILYMAIFGGFQLMKFFTMTEGNVHGIQEVEVNGVWTYVQGDNTQLILIYGTLTLIFTVAFLYGWYKNIKAAYMAQELEEAHRHIPNAKEDIYNLVDAQYHKTLLAVPLIGLMVFTIFPIIFMIFLAFTNYDSQHLPTTEPLFTWIGGKNFADIFTNGIGASSTQFGRVFGQLLLWTVIWAIFATFSNYILGMLVAIIINKKGIRLKKLWRTVLVMTIAVPQFVSLLLMSQMFSDYGFINSLFGTRIYFLTAHTVLPKVMVILINIWVGIPHTMLMVSGILMNIPADLYESAKIDGAGPVKQYMKITLPYILHVTTPSLITSFIGNLNNFGVIYLLTKGGPAMSAPYSGSAGETDLLITWLYKLVFQDNSYAMASVVSIFMFLLTSAVSLVAYNRSKAVKNEEDFM